MTRKIETLLERDIDFNGDSLAQAAATIAEFTKDHDGNYERVVFRRKYADADDSSLNLIGIRDETPDEAAQRESDAAQRKQRELAEAEALVARLKREAGGK